MIKEILRQRNLPKLWPDAPVSPTESDWEIRRRELVDILTRCVYGRMPVEQFEIRAKIVAEDRSAFAGKALHRTIELSMSLPEGVFSFPVQYFLPHATQTTSGQTGLPFFVHIAFRPNVPDKYLPAEEIIDEGFALFNFCYQDVAPDQEDEFKLGLPAFFPSCPEQPDRWGKIAMWAWAASRVLDFAGQQARDGALLDMRKACVVGHSRLGKTALWAGANDSRFQYIISNESGCGGAALERRKIGETIRDITGRFPYWFCTTYHHYADAPENMPFDQHFLIAACAPRRVYIASAAKDSWADPDAEFYSAFAASEVYRQLNLTGLISEDTLPGEDCLLTKGRIAYHRRPGTHFLSRTDWRRFMDYMKS